MHSDATAAAGPSPPKRRSKLGCDASGPSPHPFVSKSNRKVWPVGHIAFDTATTLNGWIADEAHSLAWLFAVDQSGLPEGGLAPAEATVMVQGSAPPGLYESPSATCASASFGFCQSNR